MFTTKHLFAITLGAILLGCAFLKPAARTAVEVVREACEVLGEMPPEERPLGMSLDECVDRLLAEHNAKAAQVKAAP